MADLPTGTVTLMFTDLEGSTNLIRKLGDRYGDLLADHRRLLREVVEGHGGREVDTSGDGSFIAFPSARDGVAAAVAAQQAMAGHDWPEDAPVLTRMALHTGEPRRAEEGYHGMGVHLAARLCQVGRGGQILLSQSTRVVVADDLPSGASVRDLGEWSLKDFDRPVAVFEVVVEGLGVAARSRGGRRRCGWWSQTTRCCCARAIVRLLEQAGFEVVGQADNPDDLVRRVGFSKPDVAIIDIRMPPTHTDEGLQAAGRIRERYPQVGVLVLSQYVEAEYATALLGERTEGTGYLLKDPWPTSTSSPTLCAGWRPAARRSTRRWWRMLVGRPRTDDPLGALTPREREVLELMAEGLSNHGIATRLVVTERAVEKHVTNIFAKLGLTATAEDHRRVRAVLTLLGS